MLYNIQKEKVKTDMDCIDCEQYDKNLKRCMGIGKICFEYDAVTATCLDPTTGLPLNVPNEKVENEG